MPEPPTAAERVFWQKIRDGYSYEQAAAARARETTRETHATQPTPDREG